MNDKTTAANMALDDLMLSVLVNSAAGDEPANTVVVSRDEQIKFLKRHMDALKIDDRRSIVNIIVRNNRRDSLKSTSEGLVTNLDLQPNFIIEQMYDMMNYILSKEITH